jgi:uncharacterized protein (UPF0276 family)
MIILKPIDTLQAVVYIQTRAGVANKVLLINETTNTSEIVNISVENVSYYQQFTAILALKEGHFYSLCIYNDDDILLHRDKVFCTAQNIETYTINSDTYIAPTDNNIITYE